MRHTTTDRQAAPTNAPSSFLDAIDPEVRGRLAASATPWQARAGEIIFPPRESWTRAGLVLDGVARAFLASGDARQVTVRYVRAGGMIGNVFPIAGDRAPLAIAAVTDCRGIEFDTAVLLESIESDVETAVAVLHVLSRRLEDLYATLAASAFGDTRERIAGHLLDLARLDADDGRMLVAITQQQLADSVGTVREVAARVLRDLRDDGLVRTTAGQIEILDAPRLASYVGRWRPKDRR